MKKLFLVLTIVLAFVASSFAQTDKVTTKAKSIKQVKIIGGVKAKANRYPFMTAILSSYNPDIEPLCGASFIGGRYVLTASHCVEYETPERIEVWIGGHDVNKPEGGKRIKVAKIYLHEEYDSIRTNKDIAILELVEDVTSIKPIKLLTPEMEMTIAEGDSLTVMGWGNTTNVEDAQATYPDILLETQVTRSNRQVCLDAYKNPELETSSITEFMFCAGIPEGGKGSCQGDSGGPLIIEKNGEFFQAGVVSFGIGCAEAKIPGIYSRVSKFNEWIAVKKAGVSYTQKQVKGFVEAGYDEVIAFEIKNVSRENFTVTNTEISNRVNMTAVSILDNQCDGVTLAADMTCSLKVRSKVDGIGEGSFSIISSTDTKEQEKAITKVTVHALEASSLALADVIGEDTKTATWYAGGDANWEPQTTKFADGGSALFSGEITDSQSSVLMAVIDNNRINKVNFKVAVSSEEDYDSLDILLNGTLLYSFSGTKELDYANFSVDLSQGRNRLSFLYQKDDSTKDGEDRAYLDSFSLGVSNQPPVNKPPVAKVKSAKMTVEEDKQFILDASDSSDPENDTLTYKWELVGNSSIKINAADKAKATVTAPKAAANSNIEFKVTVTDSSGGSSTANVKVAIKAKTKPVAVAPAPVPAKPKSGGSTGWLPLILVLFFAVVRQTKPK